MIVGGRRLIPVTDIYRVRPKETHVVDIRATKKRRYYKALVERLRTKPFPFQVDAVMFTEKHDGRVLIADDMGLGKTYESIAWTSLHPKRLPICVICPASVKFNWQKEWMMHRGLKAYVCSGMVGKTLEQRIKETEKRKHKSQRAKNRAIRRTRARHRRAQAREQRMFREARAADVIIINYDILDSWFEWLEKLKIQVLIIDECQYVKGRGRKRTKACRRLSRGPRHVIGLSGTPISGKPSEFFPILQMIRPDEFTSFWKFAFEYCAPRRNPFSGGWDFSGASHLEDLHERLKPIMIRRRKRDVMDDLPRKIRTIIPIEIDNQEEYDEAERDFIRWLHTKKGAEAATRASRAETIVRMNGLKMLAAVGKLRFATRWIEDWLNATDRKLFVTGIHKEVLATLCKGFPRRHLLIDGSTSNKPGAGNSPSKRQRIVNQFHEDKKKRILFGQLRSTGVGINLQHATSDVVFTEFGWSPDEHEQGEDRALRIGQTRHVHCYYLVGKGTIEERIMEIIQDKDHTVGTILDGRGGGSGLKRLIGSYFNQSRRKP